MLLKIAFFDKHLLDPQGTGGKKNKNKHLGNLAPFSISMRKVNHLKLGQIYHFLWAEKIFSFICPDFITEATGK